jgi:hypothetical protein
VQSGGLLGLDHAEESWLSTSLIHAILTDDDRFSGDSRIKVSGRNQLQSGIIVRSPEHSLTIVL